MTHELCHIFGIKHCYYFQCSLNESSSISEAATQPLFVCPICLRKLRKSLQFQTLERYRILLDATREMQRAVCEALQVWSEHFPPSNQIAASPATGGVVSDASALIISDTQTNELESDNHSDHPSSPGMRTNPALNHAIVDSDSDRSPCGTLHHHQKPSNGIAESADSEGALVSSLPRELWHSEQLEYFSKAIGWLERAIVNLEQFEQKWAVRKLLANGKSK